MATTRALRLAQTRGRKLKPPPEHADIKGMATATHDEATLRQIRTIEEYVAIEPTLLLLYLAERQASVAPPEAFDRSMRLAMKPDVYDRVRSMLTGGMDTEEFQGRFVLDNLMSRAEASWRARRPTLDGERSTSA